MWCLCFLGPASVKLALHCLQCPCHPDLAVLLPRHLIPRQINESHTLQSFSVPVYGEFQVITKVGPGISVGWSQLVSKSLCLSLCVQCDIIKINSLPVFTCNSWSLHLLPACHYGPTLKSWTRANPVVISRGSVVHKGVANGAKCG